MASVPLAKRILNRLGFSWSHTEGPELISHGVSEAVLAGGPELSARVIAELVENVRGALPGGFRITLNADGSHEVEAGPSHWMLGLPLQPPGGESPYDIDVFMVVQGIQQFVEEGTGAPWPAPGAKPFARCGTDRVVAGYADGSGDPVLVLVDRRVG